jgi:histidine kinase/DNA gyrase B/HSP90-like ATPase
MTLPSGSRGTVLTLATVLAVAAVLALVVAAVQRELALPSGPGQVWLVPAVAAAYILAAVIVPHSRLQRGLLLLVAVTWLAGSLSVHLLVAHQGVLLVGLTAVALGTIRGVGWVAVAAGVPMALGVLAQPTVALFFSAVAAVAVVAGRDRPGHYSSVAGPLAVAAGVVAAWVGARPDGSLWDPRVGLLLYEGGLVVAAGATCWAALPGPSAGIADLAVGDHRATGLAGLGVVLGEALHDPLLRVVVAHRGELEPAPVAAAGTQETAVRREGRVIAVVHHTPGGLDDDRTRQGVEQAVRLVVEGLLHHQALLDSLELLLAARRRVDSAADRRRTENAAVLRGEVVVPLEAALRTLRSLALDLEGQEALEDVVLAADQVALAVTDVNRLVSGVAPVRLGEGLLHGALVDLCARSTVPVDLTIEVGAVSGTATETALFYVCSEALVNAQKHARASSVKVDLAVRGEDLVLTVSDDGRGGADPMGSGLIGLADRLSAAGGWFRVDSPAGSGTTVVGRVPLSADLDPRADVQVAGGGGPGPSEPELVVDERPRGRVSG